MGTFHHDKGELHGVTVLVETNTGVTFVGRCHEQTDAEIILLDAADHDENQSEQTKTDWIKNACKWGVFAQHKSLRIPNPAITQVTPLGQVEI